jgi:phosphoglycerate dehydrogenase-like enzyme
MGDKIEVLVTLPFTDDHKSMLEKVSDQLNIRIIRALKENEISQEIWKEIEVLYTDRVLPTPEQSPALHWIQFHWAGINHALDEPILQKPELIVTNMSGTAASKVAEFAVCMILALGNQLNLHFNNQKKAEWPNDRWERFKSEEVRDSTVGIFGYGSIGRQIARLIQPFGGRVLATKFNAMDPIDHEYTPEGWGDPQGDLAYRIYPAEALNWMVKECDFVVVTAPLTEKTRNSFDEVIFGMMKPTAYLIDVSRGGIVDHQALVNALKERKIAGAALDVFYKEPLPADDPLWKMPNVIITPHMGGITPHYDDRAVKLFAENLHRYVEGQTMYNLYRPERGY